jgi:hypothetical protein
MSVPITTSEKFEELRKQWYMMDDVAFNIIEGMKFREGTFIRLATEKLPTSTIRCIKANAVRYLRMNFERFRFYNHPYNLYASVAKFPNMPMLSFNREKRREEQDQFNAEYLKYMTEYDFLMDIDNTDLRIAYATAYKAKEVFASANIPYTLTFSGNKGFHIRVAYNDFGAELKNLPFTDLITVLKEFAENFRTVNALYSIDTTIFDLRRIAKIPYSIVYPNYFVALPLSDEDMDNFSLPNCSMVYWMKPENMKRLYKRGTLRREGDPEAFGELVSKYSRL